MAFEELDPSITFKLLSYLSAIDLATAQQCCVMFKVLIPAVSRDREVTLRKIWPGSVIPHFLELIDSKHRNAYGGFSKGWCETLRIQEVAYLKAMESDLVSHE